MTSGRDTFRFDKLPSPTLCNARQHYPGNALNNKQYEPLNQRHDKPALQNGGDERVEKSRIEICDY